MALIEIDVEREEGQKTTWWVRINSDREGLPDLHVTGLPSFKDALDRVEDYMNEPVGL